MSYGYVSDWFPDCQRLNSMGQPNDCIFCKILSGELEVSMVYQDDRCSVFMDIQPVNPGNALVVPNRHASNLAELDEEEGAQMFRVAQPIAAALRKSGVKCDGFGLRFGPHYTNKPKRRELNEIADRIRDALQSK